MSVKTSEEQRRLFWQRHQAGETYQEIAEAYGLSRECIRYWCRRQRDGGEVRSRWRPPPAGLLSRSHRLVRYVLLRLRLEHPCWGPSRLRHHLSKRPSLRGVKLPSETQIGRYLHQWQRFRRRRKRPKQKRGRPNEAEEVHQRWQVDFKLGLPLEDGMLVNLHTVRDVVGAVCTAGSIVPAGQVGRRARRVTRQEAQTTLRAGFLRWGTMPQEVQTDGEALFVGRGDSPFPSLFTLWLVGLGIEHLVIRAGKPTDNAEVERGHRTLDEYVLSGQQHLSAAELQAALDEALDELAFELPSQAHGCAGQPPVTAHPQLLSQPRPYAAQQEWALFDLGRVDAYLAHFTWQRKVSQTGQITIGGHDKRYSVGRAYAGDRVLVRFDPAERHLVFYQESQPKQEIGRRAVRGLEVSDITGLLPHTTDFVPQQLPLQFAMPQGVNC